MANMRILTAAFLVLLSCASLFHSACSQKTTLLFAFGDSYADTGNRPKSGPNIGKSWEYPYGITWPDKRPAGRYSDGKVQTDWFADLLGLRYPPPYLYSAGQDTSSGVNFAVGDSGVTYAYGEMPLGTQVDNFELFLRTDPYSKAALANSLTLVAISGNDYSAFKGNTSTELFIYIERVIAGIEANLQRLYDLGLRNVMVPYLSPLGCLPIYTIANGYTKCDNSTDLWIQIHNSFLLGVVQSINAQNSGARFIILDQYSAFSQLIKQAPALGFTNKLKPCCAGTSNTTTCGDVVSSTQKPLYTVCKKRGKAVFWDYYHPSMWAWHYVIQLYTNTPGYILLADAPTLKQWLSINDAVQEPVAAPMAAPNTSLAAGQAVEAFNFLLGKSQYSEALGLLQSVDLEALLGQSPEGVVTVFLPNNGAFTSSETTFIDTVFSNNKVNDVALYHTANKYYDSNALITGKPAFLITLSGQQLNVSYSSQGIYLGPNATAKVVDPDLYTVPGQVAIHGIDHIIIPPGY